MSNNYGEIFCQAAEILAQNLIDKVSYDRTIVCSIINDDEKDLGKYRVSTGEAIFDAYTSDTSFKKDDQVYVSIPGGDWNEQKLIIAKKAKDINQPITYKDPFNSYVDITNNLINSNLNQQGLIANDLKKEEVLLWSYNKENSGALIESKGDILGGYTRLGINAAFQAWLRDFGIVIGNYGLRLEIETIQEDSSEVNSKFCYLNCLDMIGNPYNYEGFYNQKKLFNIADLKNISSMRLWFYQEKESFKNHKNEVVNPHISPNIFIKDVSVSLGYDANHFENDTIILYTMDSQKYDAKTIPLENNHRQLQVRWIHKFEDDTIKVIQRNDDIDYTLTWYRYEQGARSDTAWSGVDWIPLSKQVQSILEGSQNNVDYEIKDPEWVKYNNHSIIAHTPIREADYNKSWLLPDITKAEEKIKVIIEYNGAVIDSPILVFSNVDEVVNKTTIDAVQALSINCEDNSFGNYLIYNIGGGILNHAESQKVREFKAYFNSAKDNIPDDEMAELVEAESIEWIIPTKNTMIDINHLVDGAQETYIDDNGYYHIFKYDGGASTNDGIDGNIRNQNSQQYRIKSHYSSSYSDNTIKCVITKHKIKYTAIKELTFGPAGTSGTDYTFVLDFEDNVNAMTIGDTAKVVVRARLYDYEGKEIEGLEEKNIEWSVEGANYISLRELNEIDENGQKISNNH